MIFQDPDGFLVATGENSDYEAKVLSICRQWDEGQSTFTLHTSGSTGPSKSIVVSRQQIESSILLTQQTFQLESNDIAFCCWSVDTVGGLMMVLRARHLGMELWVLEPQIQPFQSMEKYRSLFFSTGKSVLYAFVPAQLDAIKQDPTSYPFLHRAKAILIGGAPMAPSLTNWVMEQNMPFYATYGMTETVSHVAIQQLAPHHDPGFHPLPSVQLREGSEGNLEILSPTSGPEWLVTRDTVEWLEPPYFRITGRLDSIINSGGVKIQLQQIDESVGQWVASRQWRGAFFAWGLPDAQWGQKLVVFFEGNEPPGEIHLFWENVADVLPKYWKPKEFILLPQFDYTTSQKIDKINTVKRYAAH